MTATYQLLIDTGNDLGYAYNATHDLISFTTNRGRSNRIGMCDVGTCTLVLSSTTGRYFPDRSGALAGFVLGRAIRLNCIVNTNTYRLFSGRIIDIRPATRDHRTFISTVEVQDAMAAMAATDVDVDLQTDQSERQLVGAILDAAGWDGSRSGTTGTTNSKIVPYAWWEDTGATQAVAEVVERDGGTFFFAADSTATYQDRWYRSRVKTSDTLDISGLVIPDPEPLRDELYTDVRVISNPLLLQNRGKVWNSNEFVMAAGGTKTFHIDFTYPVSSLVSPVATRDYRAKKNAAPHINETSNLTVTLTIISSLRATLQVTNNAAVAVRVKRLRLRGRAIRPKKHKVVKFHAPTMNLEQFDDPGSWNVGTNPTLGAAVAKFTRNRFDIDNFLVQAVDAADATGRFYLGRLASTRPRYRVTCESQSDNDVEDLVQLEVSDRVHLTHSGIGVDRSYWIDRVSFSHQGPDQNPVRAELDLSPAYSAVTDTDTQTGAVALSEEVGAQV